MPFSVNPDYLTLDKCQQDGLCFEHRCFDTSWSIYQSDETPFDMISHARGALASLDKVIPQSSITTLILFEESKLFRENTITDPAFEALSDHLATYTSTERRARIDAVCDQLPKASPEFQPNPYRANLFSLLLEWYPQLTAQKPDSRALTEMSKAFLSYWPGATQLTLIYGAKMPPDIEAKAPLTYIGPLGIDVTLKPGTSVT